MLYLAIDQYAKRLTACIRDEEGGTVLRRQVSTWPEKVEAFFSQLTVMDAEIKAILEVCSFTDWLIDELRRCECREIVLIHPEKPSNTKTDRRDAQKLANLLRLHPGRLAASYRAGPATPQRHTEAACEGCLSAMPRSNWPPSSIGIDLA
jgi:hypothetical protein